MTLKKRHPRWMQVYPQGAWTWHMSLIGHGMPAQERPTSFMSSLYQKNTQQTPAAAELLSFEGRTPIQGLPAQTGATETLLVNLADQLSEAASPLPFWPWRSLFGHYTKHGQNASQHHHLVAAADACMTAFARATGLPRSDPQLAAYDPGQISSALEYVQLARLITMVAMMSERFFPFTLICPRGDFDPHAALSINITVPQAFLTAHGVLDTREVILGITVGFADPADHQWPLLTQDQSFATLFAPEQRTSSRLYASGRTAILIL